MGDRFGHDLPTFSSISMRPRYIFMVEPFSHL